MTPSLPYPLAQLSRRAQNAKSPLEQHQAAYNLWEAALKLLASVAVVEFLRLDDKDAELRARLRSLSRPSLGHWWEIARRILPPLAEATATAERFRPLRDLLLGRARDDSPRAAGIDAVLREALEGTASSRSTVRLAELFDRLVRYRNQELGHGAAGQRTRAFYERSLCPFLAFRAGH